MGIVVFIAALVVLALVSLPYAAGDKPLAVDRALSYVIVTLVAIGAFAWRMLEFVLIDPAGLRPDLPPGSGSPPSAWSFWRERPTRSRPSAGSRSSLRRGAGQPPR